MPISRIYQATSLQPNAVIKLSEPASHHLGRVLRAKMNDEIVVFNGEGGEYPAVITAIEKKHVTVRLAEFFDRETESPLDLYLAQGISRGEKMDYIIQKAVELGAKKIIPLITQRCSVKLDQERREKRLQHWQAIIISACEQCGRNRLPELLPPQPLTEWLQATQAEWNFVLFPTSTVRLSSHPVQQDAKVALLIGPEGGLSDEEIEAALAKGFKPLNLGPRILRTETAAVAAITALQSKFGDMG